MASKATRMAELTCRFCGGTCEEVGGLVKRTGGWVCDECDQWDKEMADLDLDEWDEKRRQRLAEQQEY